MVILHFEQKKKSENFSLFSKINIFIKLKFKILSRISIHMSETYVIKPQISLIIQFNYITFFDMNFFTSVFILF